MARPLGEAVKQYLKASGLAQRMKHGPLYAAWEQAVGESLARQTRVCDFRRNTLHVEVASAALMQELAGFRKNELLAKLNQAAQPTYIDNIKFQVGNF